jgi:hypothetical protein
VIEIVVAAVGHALVARTAASLRLEERGVALGIVQIALPHDSAMAE